ncbi:hypothetical protein P7H06_09145 [Paenibacillus larvae]|nr:hypothetical protein [Paenibacillus larvae]MDT2259650.1 hypothetical protein [Paenibacillus larvae]
MERYRIHCYPRLPRHRGLYFIVWNTIIAVSSSVWNGIKSVLQSVWDGIKSAASAVWNGMKSVIIEPVKAITEKVTRF